MNSKLNELFEWPKEKPSVAADGHGWLCDENKRILTNYLGLNVKTVIEIGSWLGLSARFMMDTAPHISVIAIDHWSSTLEGHDNGGTTDPMSDPSIQKISTLWDTFLVNCWDYRERLFPVRDFSKNGVKLVASLNIDVDLIYIDGSHSYADVLLDIEMCKKFWPNAKIIGDDYGWVRSAVHDFAEAHNLTVEYEGNCWHYL